MAIPLLIGGAVRAMAGIAGIGAGLSAKEKWDEAKTMVSNAKLDHDIAQEKLNNLSNNVQKSFEHLGQLKMSIFQNQIAHIVNVISQVSGKSASSQLTDFENSLTMKDYEELTQELEELNKLELTSNVGGGLLAALTSFGLYSAVGALAAGSTTLLGGIVVAPAILVAGTFMESKAEEALTEAEKYVADVQIAIAEIETTKSFLNALNNNAGEITYILNALVERFERVKVHDNSDQTKYQQMLMVGKAMKEALNTPIVNAEGKAEKGVNVICSGILEVVSDI